MKEKVGIQSGNPLKLSCKNCGTPVGFDIVRQTYRCSHCGELTGIQEVQRDGLHWKMLQKENTRADFPGNRLEECDCPSCGAKIIFQEGEASETCDFCGSRLVRKELTEEGEMPELIIPFFITFEEARRRMLEWGHAHQNTPEGKSVVSGMGQFKGCYLPYQLVRGPVHGTISRDGNSRKYQCDGYLEGTAVNTSSQLDNLVLNEIEPFDWSAARPFTYGYIAGHKVKLNDISEAQIEKRILAEAAQDFRPEVERVMQTSGVGIQLTSGSLMELSVLLPVYFIKSGKLTAVMNGQTGRIAVSKEREKKSYPWMIEPLLYTILATLLLSIPWHLQIEEIFLDEHFCDCISACDSGSICPLGVYGAGRSFYGRIPDAIRSSMVCAGRNDRRYVSGKRSASGCL